MNRKGFTLVELLATIMALAIVMSIGTFSIISIIKNSKEKNYDALLGNIKDGAEIYYQECKFAHSSNTGITCNLNETSLGDLVKYGFLKGNGTGKNKENTLVNPLTDKEINSCKISIKYESGKLVITTRGSSASDCPTNNEYATGKMKADRQ